MIEIYSSSSNLGDNLSYTALAAHTPIRVHMYNDAGCRGVAPIFDGLCEVVFDNGGPVDGKPTNPRSTDDGTIPWPAAKRCLLQYGFPDVPAIPIMKFEEWEIAEARDFVYDLYNDSPYEGDLDICVIKASPQVTDLRTPPIELMQAIIKSRPETNFIGFGLSPKHFKHNFANVELPRVKMFWDFSIRKQAAIYQIIGKYIGCDSGDYHLMLSTGGSCEVLVPAEKWNYRYQYFHYGPECWLDQPSRVKYYDWTEPSSIKELTGTS